MNAKCSRNDRIALADRGIDPQARKAPRAPRLTDARNRRERLLLADPDTLDILARAIRFDPAILDL